MVAWARAVLLGFLSWLVPFLISFLAFPLKKPNAPLFSTVMYLVVLVTAGILLAFYFRKRAVSVREAAVVGTLWLAIDLLCDYPMFAYGPMKTTPLAYYSEIGLVYLTFPGFAVLAAWLAKPKTD
jgi:peptidoglycan/LPS O-acetylase OafA/YrhL